MAKYLFHEVIELEGKMMLGMQLDQPKPINQSPLKLSTDLPLREPATQQIRLRVRVCGVCHTDLHTVEGDLKLERLPLIPGHQVVALVDKCAEWVGGVVGGWWVGWWVGITHSWLKLEPF